MCGSDAKCDEMRNVNFFGGIRFGSWDRISEAVQTQFVFKHINPMGN
jgi:hypothetical protein